MFILQIQLLVSKDTCEPIRAILPGQAIIQKFGVKRVPIGNNSNRRQKKYDTEYKQNRSNDNAAGFKPTFEATCIKDRHFETNGAIKNFISSKSLSPSVDYALMFHSRFSNLK